MSSLTSILPQIAPTLGLTTAALYERQRALVRLKLLPKPQGRGRGSGAEATPGNIALLLIAAMATDSQSDGEGQVQKLASATFVGERRRIRCPITSAATFHEALTFLLSDEAPISNETDTLLEITVSRFEPRATISYHAWPELKEPVHTVFGSPDHRKFKVLSVSSELPHEAFLTIRQVAISAAEEDYK